MSDAKMTAGATVRKQVAADYVARLHSGELSASDEASLYDWLDSDGANREEYSRQLQIWARLGSLREDTAIQQILSSPSPAQDSRPRPRTGRLVLGSLAAAILLAVVGAYFHFASPAGGQRLVTAVGEIRTVGLSDGSNVTLNTATRLRVRMTGESRTVEFEQGEAFFDVSRDPSRPFLVRTLNGDVRVLGTQFNVRRTGRLVEVTVEEGRVEVRPKQNDEAKASPIRLAARQKIAFAAGRNTAAPVTQAAPPRVASWRSGSVIFQQDVLISVINELGRYTTKRLVLVDPQLANIAVTGVFRPHGRPGDVEGFIVGLQAAFPIRATVFADHISIEAAD